jgi:hypothetical protein
MQSDFDSTRAVISCFPAFAGGKFLSNCLSLSQNACPQDAKAATFLMQQPNNYQYRLQTVLSTLPRYQQRRQWRDFEFGDSQLYGDLQWRQWNRGIAEPLNDITRRLCNADMYFFITNHGMDPTALRKVWPKATLLILTNFRRFQKISMSVKVDQTAHDLGDVNGNYCEEKYKVLAGPDWPSWQDFEKHGYCLTHLDIKPSIKEEMAEFYHQVPNTVRMVMFDMDASIFDLKDFLTSMRKLYDDLDLTDFNKELVSQFYLAYINLHD